MNTTATGDAFEDKVFAKMQEAISRGELGLIPECCRIFRKKGYYSQKRSGSIEFDISIEVFRPGANEPSILWLWECKDYRSPVPVGEVEEFWAKVQQVTGANVKAGIAADGDLSRGALEFARNMKMAVIRVRTEFTEEIDWVCGLNRSSMRLPARLQKVRVESLEFGTQRFRSIQELLAELARFGW